MSAYPPSGPAGQPPQGYPPQGSGYGQPQGYPPQGYTAPEGYPPQGYGQPQGYSVQGAGMPPYQVAPGYHAPLPGQPGYQWGAGAAGFNFADPGQRFVARLLDGIVVGIPIAIIYILAFALIGLGAGSTSGDTPTAANGGAIGGGVLLVMVAIIIALLYEPLMLARKGPHNGQTLGKQWLKIRVTNLQGGPITAGQAWGRVLMSYVFSVISIISLIDVLSLLWDANKQTWHDKIASTFVLKAQ